MINLFYKQIKLDKDFDFYKYKFYHECPICRKERAVLVDQLNASKLINDEEIPDELPNDIKIFFETGICKQCQNESTKKESTRND